MSFSFIRLQDNYSCTQQTNHLLEKKLHCVVKPNLILQSYLVVPPKELSTLVLMDSKSHYINKPTLSN